MGKYAKIAIVLLYVAQLGLAFRDQLVHLYKNAVEMVHRESSVEHVTLRNEPIVLKRASQPRYDVVQTLAAPFIPPMALAHAAGGSHDPHPPHHDDDKHKDKTRKQRLPKIREIMYANLFMQTLRMAIPPMGEEPRERAVTCGMMRPGSALCAA